MGTFFFLLGTRKGREKSLPKEMKESLEKFKQEAEKLEQSEALKKARYVR